MTVKDLVEMLKKFDKDATVAVKYRNKGGYYYGCDYDVVPFITNLSEQADGVKAGTLLL